MTIHLDGETRTDIQIGSFPASKAQARRIVLGAAMAIVVAVAAIVVLVGTSSEVAPAIPAIEMPPLAPVANWAAPQTNAAGVEYSPANPSVQSLAPVANWAAPQTNAAGVEYSPANPYAPYVQSLAPVTSTRLGQEGPH